MSRSHIKLEELYAVAVELNQLLGTPLRPWINGMAAVGSFYIEPLNDYVSLVQAIDGEGGTRVVLPSMHRGALLKQMQVYMQGIKARPSYKQESVLYRLLPVVKGADACGAVLEITNDFCGCTIRCQLPKAHEGPHIERFTHETGTPVAILYTCDERTTCSISGTSISGPNE